MTILHPENPLFYCVLPELITPLGPFTVEKVLKRGFVYLVRTDSEVIPPGLGDWITESRYAGNYPPEIGTWIVPLNKGDLLVLKTNSYSDHESIDDERGIMLATNTLFQGEDQARTARLHGYGRVSGQNYLIQEYINPSFHSLGKYIETKQKIPLQEALQIAISVAEILAKTHLHDITHGDMSGYFPDQDSESGMGHIMWNPESRQMRIIDWGDGRSHQHIDLDYKKGLYNGDHIAIKTTLEMMLRTTPEGRSVVERVPRLTKYSKDASGTAALLQDLREVAHGLGLSL